MPVPAPPGKRRMPGEGPTPKACGWCGGEVDPARRRSSGYCCDECRDATRKARLHARQAGDAWAFALNPLLYGRLSGRVEEVRVFPQDRERIQEHWAHAGHLPVVP
jgi:hypothetical protein